MLIEALTDERVRIAAAPFDHPQIFVPNGHPGNDTSVGQLSGQAFDSMIDILETWRPTAGTTARVSGRRRGQIR